MSKSSFLENAVKTGEFNSESAKKINEIHSLAEEKSKRIDGAGLAVKNIIEMDGLISDSIEDLISHIVEIENLHKKDFELVNNNVIFVLLENQIKEIKTKYQTFINKK